ncbi:MAG: TIGR01777 family oxidoreductase [Mucilaginibacter sp.]|uniref:TIGR01777 family oxidoreductase n=1 Tax=Mucilaginibacter sp. TaxID=1882438 RepID=UPI003266F24D
MNHILITGGSGLLGKQLTAELLKKGYSVSHLSRKTGTNPEVKTYLWDVDKGTIDVNCIRGVDTIVHLAGEGIADEKWTEERKKQIIRSRTKSITLIYDLLKSKTHKVKSVVSASGIGYYSDRGNELLYEDSAPADDFLGECCVKWEHAVDAGLELELRVLKFRTGVVLTRRGGALSKMAAPIKYGFGCVLGTGNQWVPWIHLQDVIDMYLMGIENETMSGVYNMVAPYPVTNEQLTHSIAKQFRKTIWLPHAPEFALKLFLGEMATLVLGSTKVAATKIEKAGYHFKFLTVEDALKDLYSKKA